MANRTGEKRTVRNMTKNARVRLDDWMYLHELAGDDPMRVAVREVVQAHKELKDVENMDLDFGDRNNGGQD